MIKTFFNIMTLWKVKEEDQIRLIGIDEILFKKLKDDPSTTLSEESMIQFSYILGIYKYLQILLPDIDAADGWVNQPNTGKLFNGKTALDLMLSGKNEMVRDYLRAQTS